MPAQYTCVSWLEEEQPRSLNHWSSALDFLSLCSSLEVSYTRCFAPGSLFLLQGGDREPGQALGCSTLLGLSYKRENFSVIFTDDSTLKTRPFYKSISYKSISSKYPVHRICLKVAQLIMSDLTIFKDQPENLLTI